MTSAPQEAPTDRGPEGGQAKESTRAHRRKPTKAGSANKASSTRAESSSEEAKEGDGPDTATTTAQGNDSTGPEAQRATGPMETVLHMPPPEGIWTAKPEEKLPHLTPPPYVHHFDSYSLVKQLEGGGFTQAQAITTMKAVRALLAQNLDVAQGGLVSKSDVENETYLFQAACAELSAEVMNSRRVADEGLRQQRTMLQHEVDNTSQALNQELLTLKDDVKGMFNDRKMAVREEQKAAESAVSPFPLLDPTMLYPGSFVVDIYIDLADLPDRSNKLPTRSASRSTVTPSLRSRACAGSSPAAPSSACSSWWSCP